MTDERTDLATLAARLDAVERALTDDSRAVPPRAPDAMSRRSADNAAASDVRELERRVSDLAAQLDAVRGLLGGVEAVNESVERRADLALAAAERSAFERKAEGDGLAVERLPDGPTRPFGEAAAFAGDGDDGDDGDDGAGGDSLAARLREAL